MNDNLTQNHGTPALDAPPAFPSASASVSIFDRYPRGSDVEALGALRFLTEVEDVPAAWLETRAALEPGTVDAMLSGKVRPSVDVVQRLCWAVGMSRWLFLLLGSIRYGADAGLPELQWLVEERRRTLAADPDASLVELAVAATRLFFRLDDMSL